MDRVTVKKILVCGSRNFQNEFMASIFIDAYVKKSIPPGSIVLHGNARGADQIAAESAERHGSETVPYDADWKRHGNRAGILRNIEMLDAKPDSVLAFWNSKSKGTKHTIDEARARGIPVEVVIIP